MNKWLHSLLYLAGKLNTVLLEYVDVEAQVETHNNESYENKSNTFQKIHYTVQSLTAKHYSFRRPSGFSR